MWRVKPKLHMWLELCDLTDGADPALTWTYRDEDLGGAVAQMGRRRGGKFSAERVGRNTLQRFCFRHPFPYIVRR